MFLEANETYTVTLTDLDLHSFQPPRSSWPILILVGLAYLLEFLGAFAESVLRPFTVYDKPVTGPAYLTL